MLVPQQETNGNIGALGKYTLPRSLKSDEFSRWQQRIRMTNENIQLFSYGISLSKN